eukprot:TRINITY_DN224_c0_g1_i3.p1 TRINITY_DN224_c0_g1~~TRINITY_DN224_c0_g1_i3.p1  ORF type:complete len:209 (+),score=40.14 TRINITY_DN224_c0_g1_i3:175-801(+)
MIKYLLVLSVFVAFALSQAVFPTDVAWVNAQVNGVVTTKEGNVNKFTGSVLYLKEMGKAYAIQEVIVNAAPPIKAWSVRSETSVDTWTYYPTTGECTQSSSDESGCVGWDTLPNNRYNYSCSQNYPGLDLVVSVETIVTLDSSSNPIQIYSTTDIGGVLAAIVNSTLTNVGGKPTINDFSLPATCASAKRTVEKRTLNALFASVFNYF